MEAFEAKFGYYPETIVFDTVSQITMDVKILVKTREWYR